MVKPDVDKLISGTLDALKSAGVYLDDSQVVDVRGRKVYADNGLPGADIHISTVWRIRSNKRVEQQESLLTQPIKWEN